MSKPIVLIILCASLPSVAQNYDSDSVHYTPMPRPGSAVGKTELKTSGGLAYFFALQTGMLIGCDDCGKSKAYTFSAAVVQGVTIGRKFRTGIGIGFDSYLNWQALPLYGMASWDLTGSRDKNALFVQMAYGWAHPWFVRDGAYSGYTEDPFTSEKGGRMINPQIGYRIHYYDLRLSMAVGYKFQRIFYDSEQYPVYPNCLACNSISPASATNITQDMNRVQLMLTVGWK